MYAHLASTALCSLLSLQAISAQISFSVPDDRAMPFAVAGASAQSMFRAVDLNGDHWPDLLIGRYGPVATEVWIGVNDNAGSFTWSEVPGVAGEAIEAIDLNYDGLTDLVATYGPGHPNHDTLDYYLNDPGSPGTFPSTPSSVTFATGVRGVLQADVEGDGIPDLLVCRGITEVFQVFAMTPTTVHMNLVSTIATSGAAGDPACVVSDFNHDGYPDVWVGSELWINDTAFGFTPAAASLPGAGARRGAIAADIDGDGRPDPVSCWNPSTGTDPGVRVFPTMSTCGLGGLARFHAPVDLQRGTAIGFALAADLDANRRDELLCQVEANGELRMYETSLGGDIVTSDTLLDGNCVAARVADFDRDGLVDIVGARDAAANQYFVLWNQTVADSTQPSEIHAESTWLGYNHLYVDRAIYVHPLVPRDGSRRRPYRRIADAIAAATGGEAIFVYPGRYSCSSRILPEPSVLSVDDLEIVAVCGPEHTIVDLVRFELTDSRLSGFTLRTDGPDSIAADALIDCVDSTIAGNVILCDAATDAIHVRGSGASRIGSNVIQGALHGVGVEPAPGADPSAEIHNNTVVGNQTGIRFAGIGAFAIVNNLVVDNASYGIAHECGVPSSLTVDYNLVTNNGIDHATLASGGCTPILTPGAHDVDGTSWDSTAQFADVAARDFHLAGALAIDGGDPTIFPPLWLGTDFDGDPRSMGGPISTPTLRPDVGADEVQYLSGLRLEALPGTNTVDFVTTGVPSGWQEYKLFGFAPANFPLPLVNFGSNLLYDFYITTITGTPDPFGASTLTLNVRYTSSSHSKRYYVQAVVVDLFGPYPQVYPTNAAMFTSR